MADFGKFNEKIIVAVGVVDEFELCLWYVYG